jgi:predicted ATPase/DNA-binding SARP family transcriptional activator
VPAALDFRILGPLGARADELELSLGPGKQRAVLAILLVNLNRVVATEQLVEWLWPDRAPGRPQTAIQGYVSGLRKIIGRDAIETTASGYVLHADPEALDAHRCETLFAEARRARDERRHLDAANALQAAARLWHGPALADFAYESWAQNEIGRLEELRLVCTEERIDADLALGRHAELVGELEGIIGGQPLRERLRGQLMTALYRAGRQAEALDVYHRAREELREGLGIDPGSELQTLYRQILKHDEALRLDAKQPGKHAEALIGREGDLLTVTGLLGDDRVRLVTLTGPGGAGKTRLAREAAEELADAFPDGVCFVELASIDDARAVLPAIAEALELREEAGETLVATLGAHVGESLLVLDNLEQLVPDVVSLVDDLLRYLPRATFLATSRERLDVGHEHEHVVRPLSEAAAGELFTERARAARSAFEADAAVEEICRRVDCLPLALELAAARIKVLSTGELAERLQRALPVLSGGPTDLPERHRTLRATIEWSYELLAESEQRLFGRLAVFAGSFSVAAAEAVADADLDGLSALIDGSLIQRRDDTGTEARFQMLQTIREYAAECLDSTGERDRISELHARFIAERVEELDRERGAEQAQALAAFGREHDNIRVALQYCVDRRHAELALRLAAATGWFWFVRGHWTEGRRWLTEALALAPAAADGAVRGKALMTAGILAEQQEEPDVASAIYTECLELRRALGDDAGVGATLNNLASVALNREDYENARQLYEESLGKARAAGDPEGVASALCNLGEIALVSREYHGALPLFEESLAAARELKHAWGCALVLGNIGVVRIELGELHAGVVALAEALQLYGELSDPAGAAATLDRLAGALARAGKGATAARLLGAATAVRGPTHGGLNAPDRDGVQSLLAETLDSELLAALIAEGELFDLDTAVGYGLEAARSA